MNYVLTVHIAAQTVILNSSQPIVITIIGNLFDHHSVILTVTIHPIGQFSEIAKPKFYAKLSSDNYPPKIPSGKG